MIFYEFPLWAVPKRRQSSYISAAEWLEETFHSTSRTTIHTQKEVDSIFTNANFLDYWIGKNPIESDAFSTPVA